MLDRERSARMSTTVRPDNLRAALDAKLAAAMSQLARAARSRGTARHSASQPARDRRYVPAVREPRLSDRRHLREGAGRRLAVRCVVQAMAGNARRRRSSSMETTARRACATGARAGSRADRGRDFRVVGPFDHRAPVGARRAGGRSQAAHPLRRPPRIELRATSATTTCGWRDASRTTSSATTPDFFRERDGSQYADRGARRNVSPRRDVRARVPSRRRRVRRELQSRGRGRRRLLHRARRAHGRRHLGRLARSRDAHAVGRADDGLHDVGRQRHHRPSASTC